MSVLRRRHPRPARPGRSPRLRWSSSATTTTTPAARLTASTAPSRPPWPRRRPPTTGPPRRRGDPDDWPLDPVPPGRARGDLRHPQLARQSSLMTWTRSPDRNLGLPCRTRHPSPRQRSGGRVSWCPVHRSTRSSSVGMQWNRSARRAGRCVMSVVNFGQSRDRRCSRTFSRSRHNPGPLIEAIDAWLGRDRRPREVLSDQRPHFPGREAGEAFGIRFVGGRLEYHGVGAGVRHPLSGLRHRLRIPGNAEVRYRGGAPLLEFGPEPPGRVRPGRGKQIDDHLVVVRAPARRAPLLDDPPGLAYPVGRGAGREDRPVGRLAGQPQRARPGRAGDDRRCCGRWPVEGDVVELHVPAVHADPLAAQQRPQRGEVLAQQGQRRVRPRADLRHPVLDAMADPYDDPLREQPGQRGGLHRGQRHVAQGYREQADADAQLLCPGQGGGRGRDAALLEAVLPEPQLGKARVVGGAGHVAQPFGRELRAEHRAESSHAPILTSATPASSERYALRKRWQPADPSRQVLAAQERLIVAPVPASSRTAQAEVRRAAANERWMDVLTFGAATCRLVAEDSVPLAFSTVVSARVVAAVQVIDPETLAPVVLMVVWMVPLHEAELPNEVPAARAGWAASALSASPTHAATRGRASTRSIFVPPRSRIGPERHGTDIFRVTRRNRATWYYRRSPSTRARSPAPRCWG